MTSTQIINGFWQIDKDLNFPPKAITNFSEYNGEKMVSLSITQLEVSKSEQNKIINEWCNNFKNLENIEFLWLYSRANQKIFDAICEIPNLKGLNVKWGLIKNIDNLKKLQKLLHLYLSSTSIESIDAFSELKNLETLEIENLKKISDFSVLSELTQLEGLGIDGSIWTAQKINTLKPISKLTNLKYFSMTNSILADKNFDPLLNLKNLVRFNSSWNYPEKEFDKLKVLPNLKYGNVETSWKEISKNWK